MRRQNEENQTNDEERNHSKREIICYKLIIVKVQAIKLLTVRKSLTDIVKKRHNGVSTATSMDTKLKIAGRSSVPNLHISLVRMWPIRQALQCKCNA